MIRFVQFLAILFSCLALTTTSAHLLEYPQKMNLDIETYSRINGTLYLYYAIIGGIYCVIAILLSLLLVILTRKDRRLWQWNLAGFLAHVCWLVSWLTIVQPVNKNVETAAQHSFEATIPAWAELRTQWEWGHITGFAFHLLAFCFLLAGLFTAYRLTSRAA